MYDSTYQKRKFSNKMFNTTSYLRYSLEKRIPVWNSAELNVQARYNI